jgi:hypothetical protein
MRSTTAAVVATCAVVSCCTPAVKRTRAEPTRVQMAEFWTEPGAERRDLFGGPRAADASRPEPDARYEVLERDTRGFSITYHLRDARGREWHAKIGPEAQTEVVASRIGDEIASRFIARIRQKADEGLRIQ